MAKKHGGALPEIREVAYRLHVTESRASELIKQLVEVGLFDNCDGVFCPHNWNGRQFNSDGSAERMRRHRDRHRDVTSDTESDGGKNVTPLRNTDTETEQIQIYGQFENVTLTATEHSKLVERFGLAGAEQRIQNLSEYIASKGKRYKSHYATILTWARMSGDVPQPAGPKAFKAHM